MHKAAFETLGETRHQETLPPPYRDSEGPVPEAPYKPPEEQGWMDCCLSSAASMDEIIDRLRYPAMYEGEKPHFDQGPFEAFLPASRPESSSAPVHIPRVPLRRVSVTAIERIEEDAFVVSGTCYVDLTEIRDGQEVDTSSYADFKINYNRHHHLGSIYLRLR